MPINFGTQILFHSLSACPGNFDIKKIVISAALIPQPSHILYRSQVHREHHEDSDSEDTSGSGHCAATAVASTTSYRPPKKRDRERGDRHSGVGYTGYETLLVADLFRNKDRDSSTESNDVSPLAERRQTPRHMGTKRHYRTGSSSR